MLRLKLATAFCAGLLGRFRACSASPSGPSEHFLDPQAEFRPKFRYWIPDASVPASQVSQDIRDMGAVGVGGVELISFFNYGHGPALTDWSRNGFGQPAFKDLMTTAMKTCKASGMSLDLAMGPNQGQGVPSKIESLGLAKELVYANVSIGSGATFDASLPPPVVAYNALTDNVMPNEPWGRNDLLAVVAAENLGQFVLANPFSLAVLNESSLVDLTSLVQNQTLSWTAPTGAHPWVLFFIYERFTNQRASITTGSPPLAIQNGSWVVDHFSRAGAEKVAQFWDENLLDDEDIVSLLRDVGNSFWEDSLEIQAALWWTPGFAERFEKSRDYSIVKYLPVIFHASNQWGGYLPPYNTIYNLGAGYSPKGGKYHEDFRLTLSEAYRDYLVALQDWAASKGMNFSAQPAYNLPLDMSYSVPFVGVPELESLSFMGSIDNYRQFTGAAHLAGRRTISTEIGAVRTGAYTQTVPSLLRLFVDSFAAGVNQLVMHGFAYSGDYVNTTWPGYTPFQYDFTEAWNPRQPAWRHLNDTFLYAARNSMVLQQGTPKIDLAFYYNAFPWNQGGDIYVGPDLNSVGFTHEYLGPQNLLLDEAQVENNILAQEGPAFKAIVIYQQTQITPQASSALLDFATKGLPIFIVGAVPNTTIGATGQDAVSANMAKLVAMTEKVHLLPQNQPIAPALAAAGLVPRANFQGGDDALDVYTIWTSDTTRDQDYVYLANRGASGSFDITFGVAQNKCVYSLNPWTGAQDQIVTYEASSSGIRLDLSLQQNQTAILLFSGDCENAVSVTSHSENAVAIREREGRFEARLSDASEGYVNLSNGTTLAIPAGNATDPIDITSWTLSFEAYGPSEDFSTVENKITTIAVGALERLAPWTEIPAINHLSGLGIYDAEFQVSWSPDEVATLLHFGPVLNTLRAWVNGHPVGAVDPFDPSSDISHLVRSGTNTVRIEVAGTLFNSVKTHLADILTGSEPVKTPAVYADAAWAEFGLIGPVTVEAQRKVVFP